MVSPELSIHKINQESPETKLKKLSQETNAKIEVISNIPVFTIESDNKDAISKIVNFYGKTAVFRIINAGFVQDAIEFGTDKGRVEEHDFRRVADGSGYDVWGVEKKAIEAGLNKADVFCGTLYDYFIKGKDEFTSHGLGIPEDRSAILIFDGTKLREIKDTDGFAFINPQDKKSALLGVVKFKESLVEFEKTLSSLDSLEEKIKLLEAEVFQNLNNKDDLKKTPHLALNIIALLHRESLKNASNLSLLSTDRINKLKSISDRLEYEIKMIEIVDNMEGQIKMTREAFVKSDNRRMELMRTWPDFVIVTTNGYLNELELDEKYRNKLLRIIGEARLCKEELGL